jgi:hypothetical protein
MLRRASYTAGMRVPVDLPDDVARRLSADAARRGVSPGQLAAEVLDTQLSDQRGTPVRVDPFAWIGTVSSDALRGRRVEELLAKGFGRSRS